MAFFSQPPDPSGAVTTPDPMSDSRQLPSCESQHASNSLSIPSSAAAASASAPPDMADQSPSSRPDGADTTDGGSHSLFHPVMNHAIPPRRDTPNTGSISGRRSDSASPFRLTMPLISPGQLAFTAMQFLPVPVLVLNNLKTVVLANDAMGKMLGLTGDTVEPEDGCVLDKLRGQTLSQVGIDMLQDGRLVWVSWEAFLDELVVELGAKQSIDASIAGSGIGAGEATPTVDGFSSNSASPGLLGKDAPDSAVDVVVLSRGYDAHLPKSKKADYQTFAKMIITIWETEGHQTYYTLTFTNASSAPATAPGARIAVARPGSLDAAERRSIINSNPPSVGSSHDSNSPSLRLSPGSVTVSSTPFPPMGPPSRLPQGSTPSFLQKMTIIKDALLDNTEMPILAMWKDGSAPVLNRAARELFTDSSEVGPGDGYDMLNRWQVWNEDFTTQYEPFEYPMAVLIRDQTPFSGWRVGMKRRNDQEHVVFDVLGEVITDDESGEFVAGVITCRDVTHMAQEITDIKEAEAEKFKLICDTMPQMVWTTTPDGLHDFFNNRWYEYTGLPPEDSLGLGWKNPFHPDDMPATIRRWKHSLATGDPYSTTYRCLGRNGEYRWMLGRAMPYRNKQTGEIEKWFGTCTDVHENLESKMAASQTKKQLRTVLAHAQVTIFSVDRDRNVSMLEGALLGSLDSNSDSDSDSDGRQYLGRDVIDVFNDLTPQPRKGEIPNFLKPIDQILASNDVTHHLLREHEIDGRSYRTRYHPLRSKKAQNDMSSEWIVTGAIGVIMDVTELKARDVALEKQAEEKEQLRANEAAAKEASRLKSQFLANMSHEIRTPITGVIGMAELLLDLPLGEEQGEYANNIWRSANALLTVINDILDFSKVESGRLDIEEVQFSLSVVVQDVSKMLRFAAERKNLAFRSDISADIANDLVVLGDPGRVRQIITNLLTNSIKFTNNGYVYFSVWKEKETAESIEIKFVIEDTGIGIEEDVRKRLFQPFSQGDPSTARKFGGTGLGLTISKNLLDLMKGRMTLQSSIGNGTTATFWIPFMKPTSPQNASLVEIGAFPDRLQSEMSVSCNSSDFEPIGGTPPGDLPQSPLDKNAAPRRQRSVKIPTPLLLDPKELPMEERAKLQVLVVEDNAINQQIATKTIKKLGFQVSAAWNGREALDYLEASQEGKLVKPDIILMDVQMPVIDGYRCTHILRHHSPFKSYTEDVPIVAMTASAIQGDREKCTKAGMDDYLAKPVKSNTLERMLVRWSKTRRRARSVGLSVPSSISECSESGDRCVSADIPTVGVSVEVATTVTPDDLSNDQDTDLFDDDRLNLPTPKPLTKNGTHELNTFPFSMSPSTRQLDTNELAMHLRDDKLIGAAGSGSSAKAGSAITNPNPSLDRHHLTEENVEKLEKQGSACLQPRR